MKQGFYYSAYWWLVLISLAIAPTYSYAINTDSLRFSGINDIEFHQAEHNNTFAGNGFLIEHKGQLYAATVKHVLFEAKTPEMTHVWLEDDINQWRIHPLDDKTRYVQLGQLVNANKHEKIDSHILQTDWLVFKVKQNSSALIPLKIRYSPLQPGEAVRAIGCSYANKDTCTQDIYQGVFKAYSDNNLRIDLGDTPIAQLRGLSGSPVVDSEDRLVGIVSNVLPTENGSGFDFAPAKLDYLLSILPE